MAQKPSKCIISVKPYRLVGSIVTVLRTIIDFEESICRRRSRSICEGKSLQWKTSIEFKHTVEVKVINIFDIFHDKFVKQKFNELSKNLLNVIQETHITFLGFV